MYLLSYLINNKKLLSKKVSIKTFIELKLNQITIFIKLKLFIVVSKYEINYNTTESCFIMERRLLDNFIKME